MPRLLLHLEGLAFAAAAVTLSFHQGYSARAGAVAYNAVKLGLIWLTHIGVDRAVGYGLKYPSGFKDTHLQRV